MATIGPLPAGGWSAAGENVAGALTGDVYRVTAAGRGERRPGLRYAVDFPVTPGRAYALTLGYAYSAGARGRKRLTAYWIVADQDTLPYGEGPYGGGLPFHEREFGVTAATGTINYRVEGVAPAGAVGIAVELRDAWESTPWEPGEWIEGRAVSLVSQTVTLQPIPTLEPVPRIQISLYDVDTLASMVTVYAGSGADERPVRGAWEVPAASLLIFDDFLAPFGQPVTYSIRLLSASGAQIGVLTETSDPLEFEGTIVQNVVDPWKSTDAHLLVGSDDPLRWKFDGDLIRPGSARLPTWIGAGRWPLQDVPLRLGTDTEQQLRGMRSVFGLDSLEDHLPIIALRTSHPVQWPQPFVAVVPVVQPVGIDWISGGHMTHWLLTASEVQPPAVGVVRPAVTWADVAAVYGTWDAVIAAYPTWADLMRDTGLAGATSA